MTVSTKFTYKDMPTTGLTGLGGDGGGSGWSGDSDIDLLIEATGTSAKHEAFELNVNLADLNIIKVDIDNKGVPNFKMVTIIEAKDTILQESFDLRSKAAFNRVNDKLGIQL